MGKKEISCSLCNSTGTTKVSCPLNPKNYGGSGSEQKHPLASKKIKNFDDCAKYYHTLESYPAQCSAYGKTYYDNPSNKTVAKIRRLSPSPSPSKSSSSKIERYLMAESGSFLPSSKIMAFDLDSTLIVTKSGNRFPKNFSDWKIISPDLIPAIKKLSSEGYCLVVFSNQGGIKKNKQKKENMKEKFKQVMKKIDVPAVGFFATEDNEFRKPMTGMWDEFLRLYPIDKIDYDSSFYCGDAGSSDDFSESDKMFAKNIGLNFLHYHTAFIKFSNSNNSKKTRNVKKKTEPTAISSVTKRSPKKSGKSSDSYTIVGKGTLPVISKSGMNVYIMVGMPGSGKSFIAKKLSEKCKNSSGSSIVINQDELKTKAKVMKTYKSSLSNNINCIFIDRTNPKRDDRLEFIDLAKQHGYNTSIIYVETDEDTAKYLNMFRAEEQGTKKVPTVAYNIFKKNIRETPPTENEADNLFHYTPEFPDEILNKYDFVNSERSKKAINSSKTPSVISSPTGKISLIGDQNQQDDDEKEFNLTAKWTASDGVMKYTELRPREVLNNPDKFLNKYVGHYVSEKFDGWQGVWDGIEHIWTKTGKRAFSPPSWWIDLMPNNIAVAGEMIIKGPRGEWLQATSVSSLQKKDSPHWENAYFMAFDLPGMKEEPFEIRTNKLKNIVSRQCAKISKTHKRECPMIYVPQIKVQSAEHLLKYYIDILDRSGEGVVITDSQSLYHVKSGSSRAPDRVKLKGRNDDEGIIIGYNINSDGSLRSLQLKYKNTDFSLGIGFKLNEREPNVYKKLFPVGALVKFSYREMGIGGRPKEARLIGIREDLD